MKCICGYDIGEPEHGEYWLSWEECPNCERKADGIEGARSLRSERQALLRVARAAKELADFDDDEGMPFHLMIGLDKALKEVEGLIK